MFEGWVSELLASYLGHFLDVKKEQLRVSLWKGKQASTLVELHASFYEIRCLLRLLLIKSLAQEAAQANGRLSTCCSLTESALSLLLVLLLMLLLRVWHVQ